MLTKKQKVWAWIFGAMFLVPEILWGNLIKIFKLSFLPVYSNVQFFTRYPLIAFMVIIIELVGILGVIFLVNKKNNINIWIKYILNIFLIIILLFLTLSLYLSFVMTQINFF